MALSTCIFITVLAAQKAQQTKEIKTLFEPSFQYNTFSGSRNLCDFIHKSQLFLQFDSFVDGFEMDAPDEQVFKFTNQPNPVEK
jgi:hypothetical protein